MPPPHATMESAPGSGLLAAGPLALVHARAAPAAACASAPAALAAPVAPAALAALAAPQDMPAGPRVLVLAAGEMSTAEPWGRGLAFEGLAVDVRTVTAAGDAPPPEAGAPHPRRPEAPAHEVQDVQALVLHVPDALAPHLAQLRALRSSWPRLPLVAAVRALRDLDHVLALEMGADDVIDAAVGAPVVAARLRALWRRAALAVDDGAPREPPRELRFGALHLMRLEREVRLAGQTVPLTEGEFEVLWLLASHAGQALSRREILKRVRGLDDQPLDRSIDSRVYRIRAKLGDCEGGPQRIRTVRHQGYAFSPTGW